MKIQDKAALLCQLIASNPGSLDSMGADDRAVWALACRAAEFACCRIATQGFTSRELWADAEALLRTRVVS